MVDHPTPDQLIAQARERTGLSEFANDSFREGLEILCADHAELDCLNDTGRAWIDDTLVNALATRLRVDDWHRRHPELADTPVERPVFILGMPRTGTTLTSYLMEADPARRSLLKWEAYDGVPPAAPGALKTDERCLAELEKDAAMLGDDPGLAAKHFEAADGPTEDVHLMAQDMRSVMLDVVASTRRYRDWILFTDATPAFEHRKRVYQVLQSTNPGKWTLKMPSDALFVRELFSVFPDAKVIWTHRDPITCVCSVFGLRSHSRGAFMGDPDLAYMRAHFPLQLAMHAARPLQVSQERPDDFYHLYYDEMMADPLAQMRKIYDWLGDDFTAEAEAGMRGWLERNPQGRFGKHEYSLAKWGFEEGELDPYFSDYLKAHLVREKDA